LLVAEQFTDGLERAEIPEAQNRVEMRRRGEMTVITEGDAEDRSVADRVDLTFLS